MLNINVKPIGLRLLLFLIISLSGYVFCHAAFGGSADLSAQDQEDFKRDADRVAIARRSGDLTTFKTLGDSLEQKWRSKNKQQYSELMLKLCEPITSGQFSGKSGDDLARKYASSGLSMPDAISVEIEARLAEQMVTNAGKPPDAPVGPDWAANRRADVSARLHAWQRIDDEIGPPLDPKDAPTDYVYPPKGSVPHYPVPVAGVSPQAIKDPKLRAEYEAAIAVNKKKQDRFVRHHQLEQLRDQFVSWAEKYIVETYSRPPLDTKELGELLNAYNVAQDTKQRILDEVAKKITEKAQHAQTKPAPALTLPKKIIHGGHKILIHGPVKQATPQTEETPH